MPIRLTLYFALMLLFISGVFYFLLVIDKLFFIQMLLGFFFFFASRAALLNYTVYRPLSPSCRRLWLKKSLCSSIFFVSVYNIVASWRETFLSIHCPFPFFFAIGYVKLAIYYSVGDWRNGGSCHLEKFPDLSLSKQPSLPSWSQLLSTLTDKAGDKVPWKTWRYWM